MFSASLTWLITRRSHHSRCLPVTGSLTRTRVSLLSHPSYPKPISNHTAPVWACLITNEAYLPGLLTLEFSLRRVKSKYPLVALHTGSLPDKTLQALSARNIPTQQVPYLLPGPPSPPPSPTSTTSSKTQAPATTWYAKDPRFLYSFSKLAIFSLTAYTRIILLDADMLVRQNIDELFSFPLLHDQPASATNTDTEESHNHLPIFAATHACLCNPRTSNSRSPYHTPSQPSITNPVNPVHFPHYPRDWTPSNCAFTLQEHTDPSAALTSGGNPDAGLGLLNGGLLVVAPDKGVYREIEGLLRSSTQDRLPFADQSLLADGFRGRWGALAWVYNGLKTMSESSLVLFPFPGNLLWKRVRWLTVGCRMEECAWGVVVCFCSPFCGLVFSPSLQKWSINN